ncbi:MAG: hypothetical protein Q9220_002528 [cf. Caloplaca sp. 1 TL-2023]
MTSGWRLLRHDPSNRSIPRLLIKHSIGVSTYEIWITDLVNIWTEKVDQRALIQRAWHIETDIDPVEADQRQMLLRHIQESLNAEPGTNLTLLRSEESKGLLLMAHCPLPKPLKPLRWPFHLMAASQNSLADELILPLMCVQLTTHTNSASLLSLLSEKDYVITKLVDKLQSAGVDLGKVFPGAAPSKSSRKPNSREEISKSVSGLAAFDQDQWRLERACDTAIFNDCDGLLSQLFAHGKSLAPSLIKGKVDSRAWWEELSAEVPHIHGETHGPLDNNSPSPDGKESRTPKEPSRVHPVKPSTSPKQIVLPERGSNSKASTPETLTGDSSLDASDDDLNSMQPVDKNKKPGSVPVSRRSSTSSASTTSSPEPSRVASKQTSLKPEGVLGKLGGDSGPESPPKKPKLGQIGGLKPLDKPLNLPPNPSERKGRPEKKSKSPSPPRETSQERADKKREELKRQLEEKSRTGVKKKRRF